MKTKYTCMSEIKIYLLFLSSYSNKTETHHGQYNHLHFYQTQQTFVRDVQVKRHIFVLYHYEITLDKLVRILLTIDDRPYKNKFINAREQNKQN